MWDGTVLDGELIADRFAGTMAALHGSRRHRDRLRFVEAMVAAMVAGELEGIVLKDRTSTYRDGSRTGWLKVKDRSWYERESWRFARR